jgi:hypothetical protein
MGGNMGEKMGRERGFFERRGRKGYAESAEKKYQNEFKKEKRRRRNEESLTKKKTIYFLQFCLPFLLFFAPFA